MSSCSVDIDGIKAHFRANTAWNTIPIIGPLLGQFASPKIPDDDHKDLDVANGKLADEVDNWREDITKLAITNTQNLDTLVNVMPKFVDAEIEIHQLPDTNKLNVLIVHMVALAIIMSIVIFLGL